jgi:hypothetical protein
MGGFSMANIYSASIHTPTFRKISDIIEDITPKEVTNMLSREFWLDAGERAVKTFAQGLLAFLLVSGVTVVTLDWGTAIATAGTAALASVLTSLVSAVKTAKVDDEEPVRTASLLDGVKYEEAA